jgi:hypothetical protein
MAQDWFLQQALINSIMNLQVPYNVENFLTETLSVSEKLLYSMSYLYFPLNYQLECKESLQGRCNQVSGGGI